MLVVADCCLESISVATEVVSLTSDCCLFQHNLTSNFYATVSIFTLQLNAFINEPNKSITLVESETERNIAIKWRSRL